MALIKCPECGHEISDQAKKCIYCGKDLFHCPECGKTAVRHGNTCPNCGYELPVAPKPASAPAAAANTQTAPKPAPKTDLLKAWETACPAEVRRKKALGVVNHIAKLAAGLPLFLLLFHLFGVLYPVDTKTPLAALAACENFINDTFTAAIVLGCVAAIVAPVVQYWRVIPIANWLKKGTFDIAGYLKKEDMKSFGKNTDGYWAAYCALSPKGKIHCGINSVFWGVLALDDIFLCMAFRDVAFERLESIALGVNSITFPWVPFVIAIAVILVAVIVSIIPGRFCKKFLRSYAPKDEQKS